MRVLLVLAMLAVVAVAAILGPAALAQVQVPFDPSQQIVGWVCSNQQVVVYVLGLLIAHTGLSITSATLKKVGIDGSGGGILGSLVGVIRFLAIDAHPTNISIVKQAGAIMADPAKAAPVVENLQTDDVAKATVIKGALATAPLSKP